MSWLSVLEGLIALAAAVTAYLQRKGVIDDATARLLKDNYADTLLKIRAAGDARAAVAVNPGELLGDTNNRLSQPVGQPIIKDGH